MTRAMCQVMDAYISHLSQVENDKGTIKVRHELVSTTNNILNGQYVPGRNETNKFEPYDVIMGAYHQRGHWNLLIRILMLYYELKQKRENGSYKLEKIHKATGNAASRIWPNKLDTTYPRPFETTGWVQLRDILFN
ncbi:Hypothetical predicted protein, partial [Mytilus galloprovincialis]